MEDEEEVSKNRVHVNPGHFDMYVSKKDKHLAEPTVNL